MNSTSLQCCRRLPKSNINGRRKWHVCQNVCQNLPKSRQDGVRQIVSATQSHANCKAGHETAVSGLRHRPRTPLCSPGHLADPLLPGHAAPDLEAAPTAMSVQAVVKFGLRQKTAVAQVLPLLMRPEVNVRLRAKTSLAHVAAAKAAIAAERGDEDVLVPLSTSVKRKHVH